MDEARRLPGQRMEQHNTAFGVFKPVGHVLISFPSLEQARNAHRALVDQFELQLDDIRLMSDREMLRLTEESMQAESPLAWFGQEPNLVRAQHELAERGYHWLLVNAKGEEDLARKVADCAKPYGAERAQRYGTLIIEELIEHPTDLPQVAESPDRGLDAQTPSGEEAERAELRPPPDEAKDAKDAKRR